MAKLEGNVWSRSALSPPPASVSITTIRYLRKCANKHHSHAIMYFEPLPALLATQEGH